MLRTLLLIFPLLLLLNTSFQFPKSLRKLKLKGWTIEETENKIILTRKDSVTINCCVLNPTYSDVDTKYLYTMEIEKTPLLDLSEIKKRRREQILLNDSLKKYATDWSSMHLYYHFLLRSNTVDSLRIPAGIYEEQSVFIEDELERLGWLNGYFKDMKEFEELIAVRRKVFAALGFTYYPPVWNVEYKR